MIYITRKEYFNAAHKVYKPEWDDKKNYEVFGRCANPNWHGHNYTLFVTVKGKPNPETHFVMDLKVLSQLVKEHIIDIVDHRNFNLDVPFMKDVIPSTENILLAFWKIMEPQVAKHGAKLHCIKLQETENNYAEYFGE